MIKNLQSSKKIIEFVLILLSASISIIEVFLNKLAKGVVEGRPNYLTLFESLIYLSS